MKVGASPNMLHHAIVPGRYTCREDVESDEKACNSVTSLVRLSSRFVFVSERLIHEVCCLITEKDNDRIKSLKYPQLL
jgi:hypothetical protein